MTKLLMRLVRPNHERAREEAGGYVRYLRPAYQTPGQQQAAVATVATTGTGPQDWPTELAQQMQVLRDAVA